MYSKIFKVWRNQSESDKAFRVEFEAQCSSYEADVLSYYIGKAISFLSRDWSSLLKEISKEEPIQKQERKTEVLFKLFSRDEFVGYEKWDCNWRYWSYSQPGPFGARPWSGGYIPHDSKILIDKIEGE